MASSPELPISQTTQSQSLWSDYCGMASTVALGDLTVEYAGFLYIEGFLAGDKSAQELLHQWVQRPAAECAAILKGRFLVRIIDNTSSREFVFVDNAGLFPVYYSADDVCSSFRDIAKRQASAGNQINLDRALEFLMYSYVPWGNTLCDGISRLSGLDILELSSGSISVHAKHLPDLGDTVDLDTFSMSDSFSALAFAVSEMSVSVDMTGGVDSRFVAALLRSEGGEFEAALAAWPDHEDAQIGQKVADALDVPFFLTPPPETTSQSLNALYTASDGTCPRLETIERKGCLQKDRQERGIELSLDGVGGSIFKDQWWLQDFPFYSSKAPRTRRLYRAHIEPFRLPTDFLTTLAAERTEVVRQNFMSHIESSAGSRNTEVYDRVYFELQPSIGGVVNSGFHALSGVDTYSPLLEYDRSRFSFHLPRRTRSFDGYQRREISMRFPRAAAIRTTRGVTAESGLGPLAQLVAGYAANFGKRVTNKAAQMTLKRKLWPLQQPGDPIKFSAGIRDSEQFSDVITRLQQIGLLNLEANPHNVPFSLVPHLFVLGRLQEELVD